MTKIKVSSSHYANKQTLAESCSEVYAAHILGGQWCIVICCHLLGGEKRFSELKSLLPSISERMLSLQLRKMEEQQLLTRSVFAAVPPCVTYKLTEIGYALAPIIQELEIWGTKHKALS